MQTYVPTDRHGFLSFQGTASSTLSVLLPGVASVLSIGPRTGVFSRYSLSINECVNEPCMLRPGTTMLGGR